jgi:hypothetical protein
MNEVRPYIIAAAVMSTVKSQSDRETFRQEEEPSVAPQRSAQDSAIIQGSSPANPLYDRIKNPISPWLLRRVRTVPVCSAGLCRTFGTRALSTAVGAGVAWALKAHEGNFSL